MPGGSKPRKSTGGIAWKKPTLIKRLTINGEAVTLSWCFAAKTKASPSDCSTRSRRCVSVVSVSDSVFRTATAYAVAVRPTVAMKRRERWNFETPAARQTSSIVSEASPRRFSMCHNARWILSIQHKYRERPPNSA